ncbi:MAG: ATP-binding protein [Proteobacteria bacterium]|nr:ATP-binding protein [Pseudomonadota bacterium]
MRRKEIYTSIKDIFRSLSLRTQLLLILLFLLVISISSLTIIYSRSEGLIIDKVTENIDDITKAIQISVEELTYRGDSTERLKNYVDMLNKKGIKEISILSDSSEVIASSNPKKIGTKEKMGETKDKTGEKRIVRKKGLMITARLGEESKTEAQRLYSIIMPVSIKGQNIGYIHINMVLDDYKLLQRKNHFKRILSTLFAFSIGIIISLLIAEKYTEPIKKIANASKRIAEGELVKIRDRNRKDEIGILIRSYNEMVDKLSERKELEEKLKKTEQLSMIGQLSSGIAHEIRNPLNFLSLSVGHIKERVIEEKIEKRDDLIKLLDDMTKEIYKVNELIHNFLFLGKPITLNREWIPPETLINEVLYILKDKIKSGVDIKVTCKADGQLMYCDRECIRICLINLLLNSIQAIEDRGEVVIECGREDGFSYISVADNGEGIESEEMEKIFEPYYSTKKFGIGLGLAITKRFVEEHGGAISIDSKTGKGTVMKIRVPYYEV